MEPMPTLYCKSLEKFSSFVRHKVKAQVMFAFLMYASDGPDFHMKKTHFEKLYNPPPISNTDGKNMDAASVIRSSCAIAIHIRRGDRVVGSHSAGQALKP